MNKTLTTFLFLLAILLITSCNKEDYSTDSISNLKEKRKEIASIIALHSKGLKYTLVKYKKSKQFTKIASNTSPYIGEPMPEPVLVEQAFDDAALDVNDFLTNNDLSQYSAYTDLFLDRKTEISTISLVEQNFKHSTDFYTLALQIINVSGETYEEVSQNIDAVLMSTIFNSLSDIEQTILIVGAETYLDSFLFWSTSNDWKDILAVHKSSSYNTKINKIAASWCTACGSWRDGLLNGVKRYAKADAIGGVAGAIGGAAGGAVVGSIFTGGLAAGPAAVQGAVRGGVTGAVAGSVGRALYDIFGPLTAVVEDPEPPVIDAEINIGDGLIIPASWDLLPVKIIHLDEL